jgi:thiamine biosynthesis lipoprotein
MNPAASALAKGEGGPMSIGVDRRRFITISAAAAGLSLVPDRAFAKPAAHLVEWRGVSMGAVAAIRIHHNDRTAAEKLIRRVVAETRRLEGVFSLYREDSSLCELNRTGLLVAPPPELADLLALCDYFWRLTDGQFDPTVQSLWCCYADHFALAGKDSDGPSQATIKHALELVGWEKLRFDRDKIAFTRPGMGLTLNGIAQGYITDCVVGLLGTAGVENCLVDMGEIRARGRDGDRSWQVEIETSSGKIASGISISLLNRAMATSGALGFHFDQQGRYNHLFDPSTGTSASPARTVTVIADTAAMADALSTAIALMDEKRIESTLSHSAGAQVYITTADYTRMITGAP